MCSPSATPAPRSRGARSATAPVCTGPRAPWPLRSISTPAPSACSAPVCSGTRQGQPRRHGPDLDDALRGRLHDPPRVELTAGRRLVIIGLVTWPQWLLLAAGIAAAMYIAFIACLVFA